MVSRREIIRLEAAETIAGLSFSEEREQLPNIIIRVVKAVPDAIRGLPMGIRKTMNNIPS